MKLAALFTYATPVIEAQHLGCVMDLMRSDLDVDIDQFFAGPPIDAVRSIQATKFMDSHDVIVFIDHDTIFRAEDVGAIAGSAYLHQAVVGAAYSGRAPGSAIIGCPVDPRAKFFEGGGLVPAKFMGCGFMAIHTSVLRDMKQRFSMGLVDVSAGKRCYPFFASEIRSGRWYGEDVSFCRRVPSDKLYIDTRIRVGHKGSYVYQLEDCFAAVAQQQTLEFPE